MQKKVEKKEVKEEVVQVVVEKECSDLVRVFSTRPGAVECPDGTLLQYKQSATVSKEIAGWLFKSFPDMMMEIK